MVVLNLTCTINHTLFTLNKSNYDFDSYTYTVYTDKLNKLWNIHNKIFILNTGDNRENFQKT